MSVPAGEEEAPPVDIRSRIAAFDSGRLQQSSEGSSARSSLAPPSADQAGALRKIPSASSLTRRRQEEKFGNGSSDGLATKNSRKPAPAVPRRPRANTGNASLPASEQSSPRLNVKSIISTYGQKQGGDGEGPGLLAASDTDSRVKRQPRDLLEPSDDGTVTQTSTSISQPALVPNVPARSSTSLQTMSKAEDPPIPPARLHLPPHLPPRLRNGPVPQSNTGSSTSSGNGSQGGQQSNGGQAFAADGALAYAPRYTAASLHPDQKATSNLSARSWAARSSEDLTVQSRSYDTNYIGDSQSVQRNDGGQRQKWISTSKGSSSQTDLTVASPSSASSTSALTTGAPPPPPRHRFNNSVDSGASSNGDAQSSTSKQVPASLLRRPLGTTGRSPSSSQPSSPRPVPRTPSSAGRLSHQTANRSPARPLPKSTSSEALVPPPRHIGARRLAPGAVQHGAARIRTPRRARRRDERAQMTFEQEPSTQAKQRYDSLFQRQLLAQRARGLSDETLEPRTVVRLWQRSKLDAWFLGQVWQRALSASKHDVDDGTAHGLDGDPFARAMCAIDMELARRKARAGGT